CSSFSMAGNREKDWGKEKKFREGQAEQVLDNLFFDFIDLAKELQPKVVVAENVAGMMMGEAKQYVRKVYDSFLNAGYQLRVEPYLLDASKMGVPQKRKRVFFIALRNDLANQFMEQIDMFQTAPKLDLEFNEKPILFGEVRSENGKKSSANRADLMQFRIKSDKCMSDINQRKYKKNSGFNAMIRHDDEVCGTITAGETDWRYYDGDACSDYDYKVCGSYPLDYNFMTKAESGAKYMIGMSVPPVMTAQISSRIYEQWLNILK
ncbi:MAG: DNA cytosine methyltransferase, partial [Mesoflavibacter sp.]|nr:DNA cytosine methyltransferase [Mesoflavibacter sp.]